MEKGKKMELIARMNPQLKFLNEEVFGKWLPQELTEPGVRSKANLWKVPRAIEEAGEPG